MRYASISFMAVVILAVFSGCGESGSKPPALSVSGSSETTLTSETTLAAGSPASTSPVTVTGDTRTPEAAVAQFYNALQSGNETQIAALLTDKAREETAKNGLDIRSPGSDSLTYEVREVEFVTENKDGAHVKSLWNQADGNGGSISTEVIWVLRQQANGWRIAGMATQVVEGQLPLLFNFEEPLDMLQKKDYVENELTRPADGTVDPAALPGATEPSAALPADATNPASPLR